MKRTFPCLRVRYAALKQTGMAHVAHNDDKKQEEKEKTFYIYIVPY